MTYLKEQMISKDQEVMSSTQLITKMKMGLNLYLSDQAVTLLEDLREKSFYKETQITMLSKCTKQKVSVDHL